MIRQHEHSCESAAGRVAIFVDYPNILLGVRDLGFDVDLAALRDYLVAGRFLVDAYLYIATRVHHVEHDAAFHQMRSRDGFFVRSKLGKLRPNGRVKCNFDLELGLDAFRLMNRTPLDVVIIASGDGDFACLAEHVREHGIRVEVASTAASVSPELLEAASGFIDLELALPIIGRPRGAGDDDDPNSELPVEV